MSASENEQYYFDLVTELNERLKPHSCDRGLLERPFASDDFITYGKRLKGQILTAPGDKLDLSTEAIRRLDRHYKQLYLRQRLFVGTQLAFILDDSSDSVFDIQGAIEYRDVSIEGTLARYRALIAHEPGLYIDLADATIRYGLENSEDITTIEVSRAITVPVDHIVAYALQNTVEVVDEGELQ